ncbi:hypothetical protein [Bacillus sp. Cr_A10]|uniref:hypothetical protein n=1 Tax=Bacillus sp. Cr_A10 TaxID=3033993 RepID=UPI0023DA9E12|nr:hypothetical protein [Bacillus sp. Cr_A10]MDF2065086.1 hypothetical protein [Bacillus sp. Cr_A10]
MKWKEEVEKILEEKAFLQSINSGEEMKKYLESYFENFFDLKEGKEFVEFTKSTNQIRLRILDCELSVDCAGYKFYISYLENGHHQLIGRILIDEEKPMYRSNNSSSKTEFNEERLEEIFKKVFSPLRKSNNFSFS